MRLGEVLQGPRLTVTRTGNEGGVNLKHPQSQSYQTRPIEGTLTWDMFMVWCPEAEDILDNIEVREEEEDDCELRKRGTAW